MYIISMMQSKRLSSTIKMTPGINKYDKYHIDCHTIVIAQRDKKLCRKYESFITI